MISDPGLDARGHTALDMRVLIRDGKEYGTQMDIAPGFPGNPLTAEDHKQRFQDCIASSPRPFSEEKANRIIEAVNRLAQLEDVIAADVIIASSTSTLMPSDFQSEARHPERILVGHPMNPPHVIPMVELVAGVQTSEQAMKAAEVFYRNMQRVTIRVQKEVLGHLANRLTSGLYREAVYLVEQGIASVEDIDKAITYGPGMRWALIGPHLTYHLGGGKGGYQHYLDHLGPTQEERWKEHGMPRLTAEVKAALVAGVEKELENLDSETLNQRRDSALVDMMKLKQKHGF